MSRRIFKTIIIFIIFLMVLSCDSKKAPIIGELTDNIYTNQFFGFKIPLPKSWNAQDDETRKRLMLKGQSLITGNDTNFNSMLESGKLNSFSLFMFAKYPLGSPAEFNPNILSLAENIKNHSEEITSGSDYFRQVKKGMRQGNVSAEFTESKNPIRLGEIKVDVMDIKMIYGNSTIHQKYYCFVKHGYAVSIILSFINEDQESELLNAIKFLESI